MSTVASNGRILHVDGTWHDDEWTIVRPEADTGRDTIAPIAGDVLPLARFLALAPEQRSGIGVWLAPADDPLVLAGQIAATRLVAVDFPNFKDGRGYSTATLLRTRLKYAGELRAIGDVLVDQLAYLRRVGFSAFALRADQSAGHAVALLAGFSDAYQRSTAQPEPLFRRVRRGVTA